MPAADGEDVGGGVGEGAAEGLRGRVISSGIEEVGFGVVEGGRKTGRKTG